MRRIISSRRKQGQFTSAPVVSGNTTIGSVLSVTNGVFDGPSSTYTYQWFLDSSPISGATSSTYTLPALSNGILRCIVKATNALGTVKSTSNFFTIRNSFNFVVKTDNTSTGSSTVTQFKLPLISTGTYNFTVYWGDGTSNTITTWNQAQTTHTYATAGTYNISITGTITGFCFNNAGDKLKILSVGWWGPLRPSNNSGTFFGCTNLTLDNVKDVLNLTGMTALNNFFYACSSLVKVNRIGEWNTSNITSLNRMFENCYNFNDNVGGWNTSNVIDMQNVFANARNFNNGGSPDIGNWDTSKVTTFRFLFGSDANGVYHSFNQYIGDWNTSAVTNTSSMFGRNIKFNQDINTKSVTKNGVTYTAWDTKEITNMGFMFNGYAGDGNYGVFNQYIGDWNTSKVTTMGSLFQSQPKFNQDISTKVVTVNGVTYTAWDTLNVTNMGYTFYGDSFITPSEFNQNIGNWNTSKVTTMTTMLQFNTSFNQNIGTKTVTVNGTTYTAWNTSLVTNMNYMLGGCSVFNNGGSSSINDWNVANVTGITQTFWNASAFNQPLNSWNTVKVTNMGGTFYNAANFNQSLSNWKANLVTTFIEGSTNFMQGKTFYDYSTANYDALLIGWASRPVLANKTINFGTIKYTSAAVAARAILTSAPNNWTIIDGGQI